MSKLRFFRLGRIFKFTGATFLGYHLLYMPGLGIYNHFYREPFDLSSKYGKESWVVITGASDGIGKEFARQFAQKGFNLYLVSRTESKLAEIKEQCSKEHKVQVKYLAKDFTKSYEPEFFNDIFEETKDLNVSVLVNNVGMAWMGPLHTHKREDLYNHAYVNVLPQTIMSHEFVPRMLKRHEKSAIINLSSTVAVQPFATTPVYSASKAYNDYLSRAIAHEYADKIDIMSLRPNYVTTSMTNNRKGGLAISPEECVSETLKKLGHDRWTNGHWKHSLFGHILYYIPDEIMQPYWVKKRNEEQAKKNAK